MEISVVIPAFNEASSIAETLAEVLSYLKSHFKSYELIVVNDGSTDKTVDIVSAIPGVTLLQYGANRGKGYAVKSGILAAQGDAILFMDADNSTRISELDHCMQELKNVDIVIGSRALTESQVQVSQNPIKKLFGRIGNKLIQGVLGVPFHDTQCGYKLFRKNVQPVFKQQTIDRWGFDFEILYLAHRQGFRIHESPVHWVNNFDSKVSMFSYPRTLFELLTIRMRHLFPKKQ